MLRPKIVLLAQNFSRCQCYHGIFHAEFEVHSIDTEEVFVKTIKAGDADAVVICFCSAGEQETDHFLSVVSHASHLPVLTCTKKFDSDFIRLAVQHGADRFLLCTMKAEKIQGLVLEAIQGGGLKEFLQSCCLGTVSPIRAQNDRRDHSCFPPPVARERNGPALGNQPELGTKALAASFWPDLYPLAAPHLGTPSFAVDAAHQL